MNVNASYTVKKITIAGNQKTKEFIIRREMDLAEGAKVSSSHLKEVLLKNRNRIFNTGLFVNVEIVPDTSIKEEVNLYILVTERWYTIPQVIFELADRSFNEWWYQRNRDLARTNYGLGLSQHNIRGRNETLKLNFQGGFTKNVSGSYNIPYLNKRKTLGMFFGGGYSENKQVLINTVKDKQVFLKSDNVIFSKSYAYLSLNYRKSFFSTHKFIYDFAKLHGNDLIIASNPNFFGKASNTNFLNVFTYAFLHDKRNIQSYATEGHLSTIELRKTGVFKFDYYKNTQLALAHSRYYKLKHGFFIATRSKIVLNSNDQIPYLNLKTLGYNNDYIRGYDLYVIDASSYVYNKVTLRKKLITYQVNMGHLMPLHQFRSFPVSIYLNTYADMGYGYKKNIVTVDPKLLNRSLEGYGLGLDIVTAYDVVIRCEYSFNELNQNKLYLYVSTDVSF